MLIPSKEELNYLKFKKLDDLRIYGDYIAACLSPKQKKDLKEAWTQACQEQQVVIPWTQFVLEHTKVSLDLSSSSVPQNKPRYTYSVSVGAVIDTQKDILYKLNDVVRLDYKGTPFLGKLDDAWYSLNEPYISIRLIEEIKPDKSLVFTGNRQKIKISDIKFMEKIN